jgi:hypothetical protein
MPVGAKGRGRRLRAHRASPTVEVGTLKSTRSEEVVDAVDGGQVIEHSVRYQKLPASDAPGSNGDKNFRPAAACASNHHVAQCIRHVTSAERVITRFRLRSWGTSASEDQVENSHNNQNANQQENPDDPGKHFQHEDFSHMSNAL